MKIAWPQFSNTFYVWGDFMSNKLIQRILWGSCGLVTLLMILALYLQLTTPAEVGKLPELSKKPVGKDTNKLPPFREYADIWNAKINADPPPTATPPPRNTLAQDLQRYLKIDAIMSKTDAMLITLNDRKRVLVGVYDPDKKGRKNWEVKLTPLLTVIIVEIIPGKGIKFRDPRNNTEALLELEKDKVFQDKVREVKLEPQNIGSNEWAVSPVVGKSLLDNYDQYVQELGLKIHHDANGNPMGIRLRMIPPGSKANSFGLAKDDIVTSINGARLNGFSRNVIDQIIKQNQKSKTVVLTVIRNGRPVQLTYQIR